MEIPSAQFASMNEAFLDDFITDTSGYLSERYPQCAEVHAGNAMSSFIRSGIRKAGKYNLDTRACVTAFLEYQLRFGADFDKDPDHKWASDILRIRNLHGSQKLERLLRRHPL